MFKPELLLPVLDQDIPALLEATSPYNCRLIRKKFEDRVNL